MKHAFVIFLVGILCHGISGEKFSLNLNLMLISEQNQNLSKELTLKVIDTLNKAIEETTSFADIRGILDKANEDALKSVGFLGVFFVGEKSGF